MTTFALNYYSASDKSEWRIEDLVNVFRELVGTLPEACAAIDLWDHGITASTAEFGERMA